MLKLLIVEDERWEREGLVSLIDCERYGIGEILVAANGVEGLKCIEQKRPELILTDIRMPGLTGLEMLEKAGDLIAQSVCVILSGYNEFGYAQKALRIGAVDFLVKPVNEADLYRCMDHAIAMIRKRTENVRQQSTVLNMERLLSGTMPAQEMYQQLGVQSVVGMQAAVYAGLKDGVVVPLFSDKQDGITRMLLRRQDQLPQAGFDAAGIARVEKEDGLLAALQKAESAMQMAAFHRLDRPLNAAEMQREHTVSPLNLRGEHMALAQAMASLEEERVRNAMQTVRRRMMQDLTMDRARATEQITELIRELGVRVDTELTYMHTLDGMLDVVQARLLEHVTEMHKRLSEPERYVVRRLIQLIDENYYNADVNLSSLAAQIFLSPNYVGSLFKKSTGVSFSDYLCRHRLMAAERLLVEQGMRVSNVAAAVGIPNVSYFCVQFRNAYGVTPSNYKKKH